MKYLKILGVTLCLTQYASAAVKPTMPIILKCKSKLEMCLEKQAETTTNEKRTLKGFLLSRQESSKYSLGSLIFEANISPETPTLVLEHKSSGGSILLSIDLENGKYNSYAKVSGGNAKSLGQEFKTEGICIIPK